MELIFIPVCFCAWIFFLLWQMESSKRICIEEKIRDQDNLIDTLKKVIDDCNYQIGQLETQLKYQ